MSIGSNVFVQISETSKNASSKRSRVLVFFIAFIFPIGLHNYYLGYHIKGIAQTFVFLGLSIFIPPGFLVFVLPFYIAWITSEGLMYLLWFDVKDGDDFPLYDRNNPPIPKQQYAILLAFLLPFGLHNLYLGNIKRGIISWSFVAIIITLNIVFLIIPIFYLSLNFILLVVLVSWVEGMWMSIKMSKN